MHSLKDPTKATLDYNYPFAAFLSRNRSTANITYGAANCHGTAQAFAGGFLAKLPVNGLSFHSGPIEEQCKPLAAPAFEAATAKALAAGKSKPTGDLLPIEKGGYSINMNHDRTCSESECGRTSMHTFSCKGGALESYVFIEDMCINCWDKMLRDAGLAKLPKTATWKDLKPGCVLTQTDHSVTMVYQNDGLCYFYESLSPYAPPQLNVRDCPTFFSRFSSRWCPAKELEFALAAPPGEP